MMTLCLFAFSVLSCRLVCPCACAPAPVPLCVWGSQVMDHIRSELRKNDKRLQRHTSSAAKKPGQDLRRVESAQRKVHDAHARLATVTASVGHTYNELEHFKADLLLPQLLRILPASVPPWGPSNPALPITPLCHHPYLASLLPRPCCSPALRGTGLSPPTPGVRWWLLSSSM